MSKYEHSKVGLSLGFAALTLALSPLGCGSTDSDVVAAQSAELRQANGESDDASPASEGGVTLEETLKARAENQRREDEAAKNWVGDAARQRELAARLKAQLPARLPTFATQSARTRLAEMNGPEILRVLGYTADVPSTREGDKWVFDDGATRLRTSQLVPGYFKFADRAALFEANEKVGRLAPVPTEAIERIVAVKLQELGLPAAEIHRVRARAVTLDTGGPNGETNDYGTAAFVSNVHRQVHELPVIGSECSLAFDIEGALTWARCRWPQFRLAATSAPVRDYDAIVSDLARQLDRTLDPAMSVSRVDISASFAYEERATSASVEYVPVLRAILLSPEQAGAELTTPVRDEAGQGGAASR